MSDLETLREKLEPKLQELKSLIEESNSKLLAKDHFYLSRIVRSLKFYGVGDEGVDLFESTCRTAYRMYGIGETWQAVLLVLFAAEQADSSEEFSYSDDVNDFQMGRWGY